MRGQHQDLRPEQPGSPCSSPGVCDCSSWFPQGQARREAWFCSPGNCYFLPLGEEGQRRGENQRVHSLLLEEERPFQKFPKARSVLQHPQALVPRAFSRTQDTRVKGFLRARASTMRFWKGHGEGEQKGLTGGHCVDGHSSDSHQVFTDIVNQRMSLPKPREGNGRAHRSAVSLATVREWRSQDLNLCRSPWGGFHFSVLNFCLLYFVTGYHVAKAGLRLLLSRLHLQFMCCWQLSKLRQALCQWSYSPSPNVSTVDQCLTSTNSSGLE